VVAHAGVGERDAAGTTDRDLLELQLDAAVMGGEIDEVEDGRAENRLRLR
jgi:hypothetical protein